MIFSYSTKHIRIRWSFCAWPPNSDRSGQAENAVSHHVRPFAPSLALLREHNPECFALDQGCIAPELSVCLVYNTETPQGLPFCLHTCYHVWHCHTWHFIHIKYLPSRIWTSPQEDQYISRGGSESGGLRDRVWGFGSGSVKPLHIQPSEAWTDCRSCLPIWILLFLTPLSLTWFGTKLMKGLDVSVLSIWLWR